MQYIFYIYLFLFGLIFGSFGSVLIFRWRDKKKGIIAGRSECQNCHHKLGFLDLIPFFSYVFLKGKCRYCGEKVKLVYPLLEISMGAIFLLTGIFLVDYKLIFSANIYEISRLVLFLFTSFVIVIFTFYDILYLEIPDEILLPSIFILFILLLLATLFNFDIFSYFKTFSIPALNTYLINGMLGTLAIFSFFLIQIIVSNGTWMGGGDLRIAVFMGLVGGFKIALLGLMLAYLLGSIFGIILLLKNPKKNSTIPFGPYLGLGLFISLMFYDKIISMYLSIL